MNFDPQLPDPIQLNLGESFDSRLNKLRAGAYRIAYYYDYPDETTFRYRVYNMIEALNYHERRCASRCKISTSWFCLRDANALNIVVDNCDLIIFVRARLSAPVANAICQAQMRGKKIFCDLDDLVVDVDLIPLIISTLGHNINDLNVVEYWFQYVSRLAAVAKECDHYISTSPTLANRIQKQFGKNTYVLSNFYNSAQEEVSISVREKKRNKIATHHAREFKIGYFSGTNTHNKDFQFVAHSLASFMKRHKYVRLIIGGMLDFGAPLDRFASRIDRLPMINFRPLQAAIGEADLNIVPLQQNLFTRCKSELKFFEAALVLTPTLATPVGTYQASIDNHRNGWLAPFQDWGDMLEEILMIHENDQKKYQQICDAALETSKNNFSYINKGAQIENILINA